MVFATWSMVSLLGGFVFGSLRRHVSPAALVGWLGVLTMPVGIASGWGWLCLTVLPTGALCAPALAASTDAVTRLSPPDSLGEVLGWQGAATTIGVSMGAPLAGAGIDRAGPPMGFVAAGGASLLIVLVALALGGIGHSRQADTARTPGQLVPK